MRGAALETLQNPLETTNKHSNAPLPCRHGGAYRPILGRLGRWDTRSHGWFRGQRQLVLRRWHLLSMVKRHTVPR